MSITHLSSEKKGGHDMGIQMYRWSKFSCVIIWALRTKCKQCQNVVRHFKERVLFQDIVVFKTMTLAVTDLLTGNWLFP